MSLAETKERLVFRKELQQKELQEKREHILETKQKKKQLLLEKLERMEKVEQRRRELAEAAEIRSENCLTLMQHVRRRIQFRSPCSPSDGIMVIFIASLMTLFFAKGTCFFFPANDDLKDVYVILDHILHIWSL